MLDLSRLSPGQRRVVLAGDGPLLILAGPGSGKTTTLAARIAYLIAYRHVAPASVLAITFTTAAARELHVRLEGVVGARSREVDVATFHALGLRIVRQWGAALGFGPCPPAVYDRSDARALLAQAAGATGIDVERWPPGPLGAALDRYRLDEADLTAQRSVAPASLRGDSHSALPTAALATLAQAYEAVLVRRQAVDFPAMLTLSLRLLRESPAALRLIQDAYRHVVCDEAQDVCRTEYALLRLLATRHRNVVLVADPRQSIYGWRGADGRCLDAFRRDFPELRVLTLDQNYRATGRLVAVANAFSTALGYGPRLWTDNPSGRPPLLYEAQDEGAEAAFVAEEIERLLGQRLVGGPSDVAVLYRTKSQAEAIVVALRTRRVPYRIRGSGDLFGRGEVRDALAYLRLAHNPRDQASLARVVNSPPRHLGRLAAALVEDPVETDGLVDRARPYGPVAVSGAAALAECVAALHADAGRCRPATALDLVLERSGYREWLARRPDGEARLASIASLRDVAGRSQTDLGSWLAEIQLEDTSDSGTDDDGRVLLATVHSAKGGEWPVVFVVGLEEGILPHAHALPTIGEPVQSNHSGGLDEELRVAFVAITRPRTRLYLSYCRARRADGRTVPRRPSRFLRVVPEALLERAKDE